MNLATAIAQAAERLASAGIEGPRREAATLAAFATGRDRTFTFAHPEYELSGEERRIFEDAVRRRAKREPFHYITGIKEFYGLPFCVRPGVLIPRPETELLVEEAISLLSSVDRPRFLEIGVGSGCISVSMLKNVPMATAVATDISPIALETAAENAVAHAVSDRLDLVRGETYAETSGPFEIIVSNPPYIPTGDRDSLERDVVGFEPAEALFSGEDGLDVVREIAAGAPQRLVSGGSILIEIGIGQSPAVRVLLENSGLKDVRFIRDLQSIDRIAVARKGNSCI